MMSALKSKVKWRYKKNSLEMLGGGNVLEIYGANLKNTSIKITGEGNRIIIDPSAHMNDCHINIMGNENVVLVGGRCLLYCVGMNIENDGNNVNIGDNVYIAGETHMGVCEGTNLTIGDDCMFSSQIYFATSDSHSVLDFDGRRINHAKDIVVGKHCWLGTRTICLKGVHLADDCIVGAGSLLTGNYQTPNAAYGGNPAKLLKNDVTWCRERA